MSTVAKFSDLIAYSMRLRIADRRVIPAVDDAHATEKLKSLSDRQIVMSYPQLKLHGDYLGKGTRFITIHVLEKCLGPERTEEKELAQYLDIFGTVRDIVCKLQEDTSMCTQLAGLIIKNININPTYNIYGGWGGWMIEIEM